MDIDSTKLTVFFEAPFWIGVFERIERRKLSVCKVVFGAEPKDYEVWEFVLANYHRLRFSPSVDVVPRKEAVNPKRIQRRNWKTEKAAWFSDCQRLSLLSSAQCSLLSRRMDCQRRQGK